VWRVGALFPNSQEFSTPMYAPFERAARELGYIEGKNLLVERRFAEDKYERLPALAAELAQLKVDLLVAAGNAATHALAAATSTIPIIGATMIDPVRSGLAESLARPGRNITGLVNIMTDISGKHVELLAMVVPRFTRVAVLNNLKNPIAPAALQAIEAAAKPRGIQVLAVNASSREELESSFGRISNGGAQGVIILSDILFVAHHKEIARLAIAHRLPSIFNIEDYARAGGLISYGQPITYYATRTAVYMDRIFKGAKPADLPIELPTNVKLVLNRQTAKALGLAIPQEMLLRADDVVG
jgi:putative ABC transport system substrate-binding protein